MKFVSTRQFQTSTLVLMGSALLAFSPVYAEDFVFDKDADANVLSFKSQREVCSNPPPGQSFSSTSVGCTRQPAGELPVSAPAKLILGEYDIKIVPLPSLGHEIWSKYCAGETIDPACGKSAIACTACVKFDNVNLNFYTLAKGNGFTPAGEENVTIQQMFLAGPPETNNYQYPTEKGKTIMWEDLVSPKRDTLFKYLKSKSGDVKKATNQLYGFDRRARYTKWHEGIHRQLLDKYQKEREGLYNSAISRFDILVPVGSDCFNLAKKKVKDDLNAAVSLLYEKYKKFNLDFDARESQSGTYRSNMEECSCDGDSIACDRMLKAGDNYGDLPQGLP